jgi:calcineurin-like phosphoesterase family protein/2'-5' RNA ligase
MGGYLLEFRLTGSAKEFVKETAIRVAKRFHVHGVTNKRVVPHVSMIEMETYDERRLERAFEETCVNYGPMTFKFNGLGNFNRFERDKVLYVDIEPSEELVRLRAELVDRLSTFCKIDMREGHWSPHATLAFKDIDRKFGRIQEYLQGIEFPPIKHYVLRTTLIGKGSKIVREFDFFQRRSLTRLEALNSENTKLTLRLMQARAEGDVVGASLDHPFVIGQESRAFVISDTHFDHENIIRYCHRPFNSTREMNSAMVRNWNDLVRPSDIVFFLGDFSFGRGHNSIDYWLRKLNGRVFFVRGNHDADPINRALQIPSCFFVQYRGQKLMLTHDPLRPSSWSGWMVHGDKHNNSPQEYPFVNCARKTMNVCVEMIGYKPLSLDDILKEISYC